MTHHVERVDDDGVDVRARRLVRDLGDGVDDVWPEAEPEHALDDAGLVEHGVDEEDAPLLERLHLRERRLHRERADLRRDGEEELGAVRHLRLDPHVTQHQRDEPLRDG